MKQKTFIRVHVKATAGHTSFADFRTPEAAKNYVDNLDGWEVTKIEFVCKYKVVYGRSTRYFTDLDKAKEFCQKVFDELGDILSIEYV